MKWYKAVIEKKQVSTDVGRTWADSVPLETRHGRILNEYDTYDECMNTLYRWAETDEELCDYIFDSGTTKFAVTFDYGDGKLARLGVDYKNNSSDSAITSAETEVFKNLEHSTVKVEIGSRVTALGDYSFSNFRMDDLIMHSNGVSLGKSALRYSGVKNLNFDNITSMDSGACYGYVEDVEISDNSPLSAISVNCFQYGGMEHVKIGNGVKTLNQGCFANCGRLKTAEIGSGVTYISSHVFWDCPSMESCKIHALNPPTLNNSNAFSINNTCKIYVHAASLYKYKKANTWSYLSDRIYPF